MIDQLRRRPRRGRMSWGLLAALLGVACLVVGVMAFNRYRRNALRLKRAENPRREKVGRLTIWFDKFPETGMEEDWQKTGPHSNLRPQDYADPQACRKCHPKNFKNWHDHPHRKMNLLATAGSVLGDFTSGASISYQGGTAKFSRKDPGGLHRMTLTRDGKTRVYEVAETIGSRFFQYYVGRLVEAPEPEDHPMRHDRFVLPFGYWLDQEQWVPVVHISEEKVDSLRDDPFDVPANAENGVDYFEYNSHCASCHSTFALGDLLLRAFPRMGKFSPQTLHFSMAGYLPDAHPTLWPPGKSSYDLSGKELQRMMVTVHSWSAPDSAVTMGISCGACHLGVKRHVENSKMLPSFFANSPHLFIESSNSESKKAVSFGRTQRNLNAACARCHSGTRPQFAAGMSTWNSIEFADALRGACYTKLTCVNCHEPHTPTGKTWSRTPAQDDASCLGCHEQYADDRLLKQHTHHDVGSSGSRCLNCHMPRINEGLQDVVRTHLIYSPNEKTMIEQNEPNACNLCHVDQPIDWTLGFLEEWYDSTFNEDNVEFSYPEREGPVGVGWLKHRRQSVRMVGTDCLVRNKATWALKDLVEVLDDDYLLNRQFAQKGIEELLSRKLGEFGYRFYMMRDERKGPLERIRRVLLKPAGDKGQGP